MRLNAQCRGSQAITTFEWFGSQPKPVSTHTQSCIDWEALDAWNAARRVDLYDLGQLEGRPPREPWELVDHALRLGEVEGNVSGFERVLEGKEGI